MKQYKYILFILLFSCVYSVKTQAQIRNYTLMASQADWKRLDFNPSYMPNEDTKLVISLPLLSEINLDTKLPFFNSKSYKINGNKMDIYPDEVLKSLGGQALSTALNLNLLGVAWKKNNNFFSINIAMRSSLFNLMDKQLTEVLVKGNGAYAGELINARNSTLNLNLWGEMNLGYSTSLLENKLRLGARAKFLLGLANYHTKHSTIKLKTLKSGERIELFFKEEAYLNAPISINDDNGRLDFDNTSFKTKDLGDFKPFDNFGLGLDLGVEYKLNEQFTFGASVTNLGFIKWGAKNSTKLSIDVKEDEPIVFEGLSFRDKIIGNKDESSKKDENKLDVKEQIERNSKVEQNSAYKTYLPTFYNLTAEYKPIKNLSAKALIGLIDYHNPAGVAYELALVAHWQAKSWFASSLSVSKVRYQPICLGASILLGKGLQWVIGSDNLLGFFNYSFSPNAYLGLNIRI